MDGSVIVLSSGSEDESDTEASVFLVESPSVPVREGAVELVDDDLTITYIQKGAVLPHARSDCPAHPFREKPGTEKGNISYCDQCFCYVCDTLASECGVWRTHCDAHPRCSVWRAQREMKTLGVFHKLGFTMEDRDQEMRSAESALQIFSQTLSKKLATFQQSGHSFACVCECVSEFVSRAEQESLKTGALMMVGVAQLFTHTLALSTGSCDPVVDPKDNLAVGLLLNRVFACLLQVCVDITLPSSIVQKLQRSCSLLSVPTQCKTNWLNVQAVRVWDDLLLTAVLKGQNISGRTNRKNTSVSVLRENPAVVTARVHQLLQRNRYREVARYLKVVQCDETSAIKELRDLVPLYLCQAGDIPAAIEALFSPIGHAPSCPAARLTPPQLHSYLRIFTTGHAPKPHHSSQRHPLAASVWEPIKGVCVLKAPQVVKFALRVLHCNNASFNDVRTWENLVMFVSSQPGADGRDNLTAYTQPDTHFLTRAHEISQNILSDLRTTRLQIPKSLLEVYPRQALLLLVTEALAQRIISQSHLSPSLNLLLNYRVNLWAMRWLYKRLASDPLSLHSLFIDTLKELLQPLTRKLGPDENIFISDFLCLYFLDERPVAPPMADLLLDNWNESAFPWQFYLRQTLEHWRADLSPEKSTILQRIKTAVTTY